MVSKQIQKLPKSVVEAQITVPWADVANQWNTAVATINQQQEIPGFRKGQAPVDMLESKFGQQIQQEFFRVVMPQALVEGLQGTEVVPIDYPQYQIVSFTKGGDLVFKARVTSRPEVKVGEYKTIKAARPAINPIPEEEITRVVDDLFGRWQARAGQPNQPGPAPAPAAGTMNPSTVTAPNDEFAQAVGAANLQDLRTKIRQDMEDEAKYENELDYEENILAEVEKITTVDLPEVLIQDELNRMLVSLQRRVADAGMLLDDYLKGQNKTMEQVKAEWLPQAEKNVRMELGLSEIARLENVSISEQELQAEIDKIQDQRMKQQFEQQEPRMHLRHALRQTRTLNLLKGVVGQA